MFPRDLLGSAVVKILQRARAESLVGELRSHMPYVPPATKKKKLFLKKEIRIDLFIKCNVTNNSETLGMQQ